MSGHILILSDNTNRDFVSRIHSGASRHGSSAGVKVVMENINGTGKEAGDCLDQQGLGGVLLTAPLCDDRHLLLQLEKRNIPYVRIGSMLDSGRGITVTMDEYDAARVVTTTLLEAGHRRIGIIRGPRSHLSSMRRYNGFVTALGAKGLKPEPGLIVEGDYTRESGAEQGAKLLAAQPTAVFASNDNMALGFTDAARRAGLSLPRDLSLVGFDDDPFAKTMAPPLTSIRQPLEEMGAKACEKMVAAMKGGATTGHADVPYQLVERASVAPPAG